MWLTTHLRLTQSTAPSFYPFFFLFPANLKDGKRNTFNQNQPIGSLFIY